MTNVHFIPGGLYRIVNTADRRYKCISAYQNTILDDSGDHVEALTKLRVEMLAGYIEIGELVIYIKSAKHLRFEHVASSLGLVIIPTFCLKREK